METSAAVRSRVLFDAYAGLRKVGYGALGAIRALRVLGVSLAEAKETAERYDPSETNWKKVPVSKFDTLLSSS